MGPIHALVCVLCATLVNLLPFSMFTTAAETVTSQPSALRFEVRLSQAPTAKNAGSSRAGGAACSGRLLVILGKPGTVEPRLSVGQTGQGASPILGGDVSLAPGAMAVLDNQSVFFPLENLNQLRPGTYAVQALLHTNIDLNLANAPGDLYSPVTTVRLDPAAGGIVRLELSYAVPTETLPADQDLVKYLKIRSRLLSEFHGRSIDLRAGVSCRATIIIIQTDATR